LVKYKCDIFHIQWAKDIENWMFLQDLGIKIVGSLRGAHINYSPLADLKLAQIYRDTFPSVNSFHAVSLAIKSEAIKYGAIRENIHVIYSGLNAEKFKFIPEFNTVEKKIHMISIGRPHWKKGYHLALDALKLLKTDGIDFNYTIIGGINDEIMYQIVDLELVEQVKIIPKLKFEDIKIQIQQHDLLLLPSVEEGIANVVLEAMALGTLVLSSNCGGMAEVLVHGENGLIFENRNVIDMKNKLLEVLNLKERKAIELINRARITVETQHNEINMVREFLNLYENT